MSDTKIMLTPNNYFSVEADNQYMSVSQFKGFLKCEAAAIAKLKGEWQFIPTTAMMVGSYVDAYFEGTLPQFAAEHQEIFKKDGTLKAEYVKASQIIDRIESDEVFMSFMNGEKQAIITAPLFDAEWKIKIDVYHPNERIVDLKVMRSLEPVMGKSFIEHWLYDLQMAVYSEVERIKNNRLLRLPTELAVATKEDYPDIEIINIPDWKKEESLEWLAKTLPEVLEVKQGRREARRCGICDYCRATKKLTGPIDFQDVGISYYELARMRGEY